MSNIATSAPTSPSGSSEFFAAIVQIFHPSAHVMLTRYKVIAILIGDGRDGILLCCLPNGPATGYGGAPFDVGVEG